MLAIDAQDDSSLEQQISPMIHCEQCSGIVQLERGSFPNYFETGFWPCPRCGFRLDLWTRARKTLLEAGFGMLIFGLIGAEFVMFEEGFTPGVRKEIRLEERGVPENAKILEIVVTPYGGGIFPIYVHGNRLPHSITSNRMQFYPMAWDESDVTETTASFSVVWMEKENLDGSNLSLFEAFEAYWQRGQALSVIPAATAIELSLRNFLGNYYERSAARARVDSLLDDASFSHQFNVLLASAIRELGLTPLSDEIRGRVNQLRKQRNVQAHSGRLRDSLSREEAANHLCAALFAVNYLKWCDRSL